MSATHSMSGQLALKSRSTRSGAGAASRSWSVVRVERRRWMPSSPAARMSRATRLREQWVPVSRSSAWTRGMPYVPRLRVWMPRITLVSSASEQARADGGRFDQAQ